VDEVMAVTSEEHLVPCRHRRRFRRKHALLSQVVEQWCQRRQSRNSAVASGPSLVQELLGDRRRERLDAKTPRGEPAVQLAHQHDVVLQ
jgi:hypothetical protein